MGKRSVFLMAKPYSMWETGSSSLRSQILSIKLENTLRVGPENELSLFRERIRKVVVGLRRNNGHSSLLRASRKGTQPCAFSFYDCTYGCCRFCSNHSWT